MSRKNENAGAYELDLHLTQEDPDAGIAPDGVWCRDMAEIAGRIREVKDTVKIINLKGQESLSEIPAVLGECRLIEELDVSHTEIKEIPDFVFSMPNLRALSCFCDIHSLENTAFSKAVNLEKLDILVGRGQNIPESICTLQKLKSLRILSYSSLSLPENLGFLKNLEEISLSLLDFSEAPLINFNNVTKILASCKTLEVFYFHGFAIGKDQQYLSRLKGLRELSLVNLQTEGDLFETISRLPHLKSLEIRGSDFNITCLPDVFGALSGLRSFSFSSTFIKTLPPSIYGLSKLRKLEISGTGISGLDEQIGNLSDLEELLICDNMLETLPETIFDLPNLKILDIEANMFKKKEIASIKKKAKAKFGKKCELRTGFQGHEQNIKKFRTMSITAKDIDEKDGFFPYSGPYFRQGLAAIKENPHAIKYAHKNLNNGAYDDLCLAAAEISPFALEDIDPERLPRPFDSYFRVCLKAAGGGIHSSRIGYAFRYIRDEFLDERQYAIVCLQAAINNSDNVFLQHVKTGRLSRENYECICRAAVLRSPDTIRGVIDPSPELCLLAAKFGAYLFQIPKPMLSREIYLTALKGKNADRNIQFVPSDVRDEEINKLITEIEKKKQREEPAFGDDIPF
ncbi:MAG: hypothetical protein FWH35_00555 [Treponema sp.]|nr:hypothetical protein [Treponema sp.]